MCNGGVVKFLGHFLTSLRGSIPKAKINNYELCAHGVSFVSPVISFTRPSYHHHSSLIFYSPLSLALLYSPFLSAPPFSCPRLHSPSLSSQLLSSPLLSSQPLSPQLQVRFAFWSTSLKVNFYESSEDLAKQDCNITRKQKDSVREDAEFEMSFIKVPPAF